MQHFLVNVLFTGSSQHHRLFTSLALCRQLAQRLGVTTLEPYSYQTLGNVSAFQFLFASPLKGNKEQAASTLCAHLLGHLLEPAELLPEGADFPGDDWSSALGQRQKTIHQQWEQAFGIYPLKTPEPIKACDHLELLSAYWQPCRAEATTRLLLTSSLGRLTLRRDQALVELLTALTPDHEQAAA